MNRRNYLGRFAPKFTREEKILSRIILFLLVYLFIAGTIHAYRNAEVTAYNPLLPKAEAAETPEAIDEMLQKIADCESGLRNPDGSPVPNSARQFFKNGKVIKNVNRDGSFDFGWAQINLSAHLDEIVRLRLDVINSEEDNKTYARILYEHEGTTPWNSSKKCWSN